MAFRPIHNSKFDILVFGDLTFEGSQEGEYITVTPRNPLFNSTVDATGQNVAASINNDYRADVVLRVQRQSPINLALTEIVRELQDSGTFTARDITFAVSDTLHMYDLKDCAIMQLPTESTTTSGDSGLDAVEWAFECSRLVPKQLSDADFGVAITATLSDALDLTIAGRFTI